MSASRLLVRELNWEERQAIHSALADELLAVEQGGVDGVCPVCRERAPVFRHGRAALRYDQQARRLILPLKHADRVELASVLAPMMVRAGAALLARAEG